MTFLIGIASFFTICIYIHRLKIDDISHWNCNFFYYLYIYWQVKKDEKNNRNDLYVLANSYSGRLRAKKPKLLSEKDFHVVRKPEEKKNPPVANGVESKVGLV